MKKYGFTNACVAFNGDPYVAENEAEVKECENFVMQAGVQLEEFTPKDEPEFTDICELLNVDRNTAEVKRVYKAHKYNEEPMYFCLDSDWTFKH